MGERIPKQPNKSRGENLPEAESKTPRCKALAGQRTSPLLALPVAGFINNSTPNQPIQTSWLLYKDKDHGTFVQQAYLNETLLQRALTLSLGRKYTDS